MASKKSVVKQFRKFPKLIALRVSVALWDDVKKVAALDGRSAASWVRRTLESAVKSVSNS